MLQLAVLEQLLRALPTAHLQCQSAACGGHKAVLAQCSTTAMALVHRTMHSVRLIHTLKQRVFHDYRWSLVPAMVWLRHLVYGNSDHYVAQCV